MASFTDIIPQFNPYVQQLPVEAMVAVGMEKQKRYDEGIQKIQSQIDNIAGLDVIRDVDKAYLQSKLNELGNNLKIVAAGDFSNFQLVNSVSGMTNQIVKDPVVLNAISSTKAYRKGIEDMNTLIKEGKGSSSRTWEFKTKANNWLTSDDVNETFDAVYKPYTNYKKNALEVLKGLTGDSTIRDDAFRINADGTLEITDAMTRTKLAGISPEKIQQALLSGLSPDDWEQIELDGRYTYANTTPISFAESLNKSFNTRYSSFAAQKKQLEDARSTTSSAEEKEKIDTKVAEIDKMLKNMVSEYDIITKTFSEGDVESAKAKLFTNDWMNGFSKSFSYTETSQTYESSPFVQAEQWRQNQNQEWKKFMLKYQQDERFHADDQYWKRVEAEQKAAENRGYGGVLTPTKPGETPKVSLENVVAQAQGLTKAADTMDSELLAAKGKDAAWLADQRKAWLLRPNGVDPDIAQHFNKTEGLRKLAQDNQTMVNMIESEANTKFGDVYSRIPKDAPNIWYRKGDGTTFTMTPRDFVNFWSKLDRYKYQDVSDKVTSQSGPVYVTKYRDDLAQKELSPNELIMYEVYKKGINATQSGGNEVIRQNMLQYGNLVNEQQEIIKKRNEYVADEVNRRVIAAQGKEYAIPATGKVDQETLAAAYMSIVNLTKAQNNALANSPGYSESTLEEIAKGGNVQGTFRIVEGSDYSDPIYEVTAFSDKGSTTFRLNAEQKFSIFGNRFEATPNMRAFQPIYNTMKKFSKVNADGTPSRFMSTNPQGGETNIGNAKLTPADFFSVKSYGVSGNVETADGGTTYSLKMNVYDPIKKKLIENVPYPRLLLAEEVAPILQGLTDAAVYQILNNRTATAAELQRLQNESKKPF